MQSILQLQANKDKGSKEVAAADSSDSSKTPRVVKDRETALSILTSPTVNPNRKNDIIGEMELDDEDIFDLFDEDKAVREELRREKKELRRN